MTKEELEFLKELQHELRTQGTDGNARPVFWGIQEDRVQTVPDGFGDRKVVVRHEEEWSPEEFVVKVDFLVGLDGNPDTAGRWAEVDKDRIEDVVEFASDSGLMAGAEVFEVRDVGSLSDQTGCFLTKRAARKHIELNGYHYRNPRTYAMTAWRNPEFEKFLDIFEKLDLDKLGKLMCDDDR